MLGNGFFCSCIGGFTGNFCQIPPGPPTTTAAPTTTIALLFDSCLFGLAGCFGGLFEWLFKYFHKLEGNIIFFELDSTCVAVLKNRINNSILLI